MKKDHELIFASEIKAILAHPSVNAELDREGLNEIFGIGPARSTGCGVLKGMKEVCPGEYITYGKKRALQRKVYWKLESYPHTDSYEKTVETVAELVQDSIRRQMVSDVPICTFLSGGVDSSLVSAVCAAGGTPFNPLRIALMWKKWYSILAQNIIFWNVITHISLPCCMIP